MKELEGRLINSIALNDDQTLLSFETDKGILNYRAIGDCCSVSWFNDILGVSALLGGKVTEVIEMKEKEAEEYESKEKHPFTPQIAIEDNTELIQIYGYKIITNKGHGEIIFRNASNGYYGGELELVEDDAHCLSPWRAYNLGDEPTREKEIMHPIIEDWGC